MKIAFFEADQTVHEAASSLTGHDVSFTDAPLTALNAADYADADIACVFICSVVDEEVLALMPKLKFVATRSTGFDHIRRADCTPRGVSASNVPSYGAPTVAEHAAALLLGLSHKLVEAVGRTRAGNFSFDGLRGFDLKGKTIGIVGTGAIGRSMVDIALGFGMHVLASDTAPDMELAHSNAVKYVGLDELLAGSDVVSLHVPLNRDTRGMIGAREFALMKDGAILINTARGEVVETRALLAALDSGKLAGAGLDVLADECHLRDTGICANPDSLSADARATFDANMALLARDNVLVTPHSAFSTREAAGRILDISLENICAFIKGEPVNLI